MTVNSLVARLCLFESVVRRSRERYETQQTVRYKNVRKVQLSYDTKDSVSLEGQHDLRTASSMVKDTVGLAGGHGRL